MAISGRSRTSGPDHTHSVQAASRLAAKPIGCSAQEEIALAGGSFWMGSDEAYPEERPARQVSVEPFRLDPRPITNAQFAAFVQATGHVSAAEIAPKAEDYPGADPAMLRAGSAVFMPQNQPVPLNDPFRWWSFIHGACWHSPTGPGSSIKGLEDHPVVHVSWSDAKAYAEWAGKRLPTEAEWEFAARGGLDRSAFAWGDELAPGGQMLANYWQGRFPHENTLDDGYLRTSPVGSYPANGLGLYDMIGNVWEWTQDWYSEGLQSTEKAERHSCCIISNPRGGSEAESLRFNAPGEIYGRKVLKGGSHLCAQNYCQRYRPAARYAQTIDSSTSHIGFRCARDAALSH